MTKHLKSTKANSLQAMTKDLLKNQIHKIRRYDEMCKMLIINLVEGRQHKFKSISNSAYPQEEKDLRLEAEVEHTGKLISQTANHITDLHQKMEKELESMEQEVCQGDVQRSTLARYFGLVLDTAEMVIFREIERMEKKDLRRAMDLYVELMATQPEIEQQLKLIVEYRHMLRNINKKHMEQQIKVELQTKILKQHKDRYKSRITPKIDPRDLDKTGAHFREEQQGAKQVEQAVAPLKTCSQGQHGNGYNKLSSESFAQSKKML